MKNTHVCSKYDFKNILHIPGNSSRYVDGNNISVDGWTVLSKVKVSRYLGAECRYGEELIIDKNYIIRLLQKYQE